MIHLDAPTSALLDRLERFAADNDARAAERSQKMLNLERPTAELVFWLVASVEALSRAGDRHVEWLQRDLACQRITS